MGNASLKGWGVRGMSEVGARPRWRDALVLTALAAVIVAGLIHYGIGLRADEKASEAAGMAGTPTPGTSTSPTDGATAELEGAPPADLSAPAQSSGGTCWDGRETLALRLCGLPDGVRGLEWVFPSFAADR